MKIKILKSLLIVLVTFPLCISMATSYFVESKNLMSQEENASIILVSYKFSSEPAIMILLGFGLLGIAGIGRRMFITKESDQKRPISLASARPPFPELVPWKKDT